MNLLFIVGAGNFGRELLGWALDIPNPGWEVGGFLDSRPNLLYGYDVPFPILGDPLTFEFTASDRFVCAVADPRAKLHYCRQLEARGAVFETLIHPSATLGRRNQIGPGCVLCPQSIVTCDVRLGRHVLLNVAASVGHDASIGDGCTLSGHADATGRTVLGEGVFLGSHASVAPGVRVGDYAVVGAASAALRDVAPYSTVLGVPACEIYRARPSGRSPAE